MEYTKEDLMFTWGVVESKEHAAFIAELAKNAGFNCTEKYKGHFSFAFYPSGNFSFHQIEIGELNTDKLKQITIPLPPKGKEWPQVGGEALALSGRKVDVLAINGESAWVKYQGYRNYYATLKISDLKKPKSKQDLLIEELHQKLLANNCSDEYLLACDIVQGKVEGLSYE